MEHSPRNIAERRLDLSAEYSRYSDLLEKILMDKPRIWMEMREQLKSDKQADRAWEGSELGLAETKYRLRLKAIEKKLSAARTYLEVLTGEANNQY
jgi:hypothetical protein